MKDNKLIAEFMGWGVNDGYLFPPNDECMHGIDGWTAEDIPYHTSWDWLMPVVDKCYQEHMSKHIADAVMTCDIDTTYKVVVEFIQEYNDGCHQTYNDERQ